MLVALVELLVALLVLVPSVLALVPSVLVLSVLCCAGSRSLVFFSLDLLLLRCC